MNIFDDTTREIAPATAIRLVVMLYDGAIAALQAAAEAIEREDAAESSKNLSLAGDIVSQLYLALDAEKGGEIADNLGKIYGYMLSRLRQADLANDPEPVREIIGLLYHLYLSWRELDFRISSEESSETAQPEFPDRETRLPR